MHQTKKGNQWRFGMKMRIGVDAESGLVHSVQTALMMLERGVEVSYEAIRLWTLKFGYRVRTPNSATQRGHVPHRTMRYTGTLIASGERGR
jgi:transposase-like protein